MIDSIVEAVPVNGVIILTDSTVHNVVMYSPTFEGSVTVESHILAFRIRCEQFEDGMSTKVHGNQYES